MSIGWALCINGIIGIVALFGWTFIFTILMGMKYGLDIVQEAMEDLSKHNDDTYNAITNHPELLKAISMMVTIFLWEFCLPIVFDILRQNIVELYKTKNHQ